MLYNKKHYPLTNCLSLKKGHCHPHLKTNKNLFLLNRTY